MAVSAAPASAQDADYGTDGFLGRVSRGTEEVDRCQTPDAAAPVRTARAADHYDRGLVLYEQGDYAGAVEEFVASYCDKPHPSAFYNIGQSFERLLAYDKAVAYFERYILESEPDAPNRKRAALRAEVLENTPAQVHVATVPAGATVTLSGDTGVTARAEANADAPLLVRKGRYQMRVELAGYVPVEQEIVARIGQPYSYYFRLEPEKGSLRVVATPNSARIFVDRKLVGLGSYVEAVPVGRYEVVVEAEGRAPEQRQVEITAGQSTELGIELAEPPGSGRGVLLWASSVGLGLAGSGTLGGVLDGDPTLTTLGGVLGLGIGWGGAYFGVPHDIPRPHAWHIIGSTLLGAAEGAIVTAYLVCDTEEFEGRLTRRCSEDGIAAGALASAMGGLLFGAVTAARFDPTAGDVAVVDSAAAWGVTGAGLFLAVFDNDPRIREPMLFAGLNLGLVAGATLAARSDVSLRRVALVDLGGLAGLVGGFAAGQAADSDDERLDHLALIGMATGLIATTLLTQNLDDDEPGAGSLAPAPSAATDASGRAVPTLGARWSF